MSIYLAPLGLNNENTQHQHFGVLHPGRRKPRSCFANGGYAGLTTRLACPGLDSLSPFQGF